MLANKSELTLELQSKSHELTETMKTILEFPKRLEYECMVPISKVAFMPGRIVHTNEILLLKEPTMTSTKPLNAEPLFDPSNLEKNGQWFSYFDAAEILKIRAADCEKQLQVLNSSGSNCYGTTLSDVIEAHDTAKKAASMSPSTITLNTVPTRVADKDQKGTHACSEEYGHRGDSGGDSEGDDNSYANDGTENARDIFEIREFIDSEGNEMSNEIVNLQQEMADIEDKLASLTSTEGPGDGGSAKPVRDEAHRGPHNMSALLSSMQNVSAEMRRPLKPENNLCVERFLNASSDLSSSIGNRAHENEVLCRLEHLEREEDEWQKESDAADRIRIREKELLEKALPEAGPRGWKKGFLGKSSVRPVTAVPVKIRMSTAPVQSSSSSSRESFQSVIDYSTSHQNPVQREDFDGTGIVDYHVKSPLVGLQKKLPQASPIKDAVTTTTAIGSGTKQRVVPVSKAFTGNIVERFP